jgi:hypothetical protein
MASCGKSISSSPPPKAAENGVVDVVLSRFVHMYGKTIFMTDSKSSLQDTGLSCLDLS